MAFPQFSKITFFRDTKWRPVMGEWNWNSSQKPRKTVEETETKIHREIKQYIHNKLYLLLWFSENDYTIQMQVNDGNWKYSWSSWTFLRHLFDFIMLMRRPQSRRVAGGGWELKYLHFRAGSSKFTQISFQPSTQKNGVQVDIVHYIPRI